MAVQRFMYLNDLSGVDFFSLLHGRKYRRPNTSPRGHEAFRQHLASVNSQISFEFSHYAEIDHRALEGRMGHYTSFMEPELPLRFCSECLVHCYHSPIFQFPALSKCPFHQADLRVDCWHCGKNLSTFGFLPENHLKPFCCTSCGVAYVPEDQVASRVLFGIPEAMHALQHAEVVVTRMSMVDVTSANPLVRHDMNCDQYSRFHCHALYAAARLGTPKPDWLIGLDKEVAINTVSDKWAAFPAGGKQSTKPEAETLNVHLQSLTRLLRSIDRFLSRKVRSVCGHQHHKWLINSVRSIPRHGKLFFVELAQQDCPCCAVMTWWRANFGIYFALLQWIRDTPFKLNLVPDLAWLEEFVPLRPERLAATALASFSSMAIQVAYRLCPNTYDLERLQGRLYTDASDKKTLLQSWHFFRDNLKQQKLCDGYFELPIDDDYVSKAALLCIDANGEQCSVSYSLNNAIDALVACHSVNQSGHIWCVSQYQFIRAMRQLRCDHWYQSFERREAMNNWGNAFNYAFHAFHRQPENQAQMTLW